MATNKYNAGFNAGKNTSKTVSVYLSGYAEYVDNGWKGGAECTINGQRLKAHAGQSLNTTITIN